MSPLNDPAPLPTTREKLDWAWTTHADIVAQVGLTISLAIAFTILGTALVALGIILGLAVALAVRSVR